ncbi:transposase family protein [Streptomyces sp900116325]|uniref:transposase family protein n=1 Tax=Streptomyces sp. 900116325 TaxID=3154295 RepID=UPI0033F69E2B
MKPQGGELSVDHKANNRRISSTRSTVERRIALLKNWKMLANGYRARLAELSTVIPIIKALEFYRYGLQSALCARSS